jgi:opacity protein-like surface antigen
MFVRSLRGLLAATALLAAVTTTAEAQSRFGVTAGISSPMGDFGDVADLGFTVGAQYAMPLSGAVGLRFNGDYSRFGANGVDANWSLLGAMANLTYDINTESGFKPYLLGGLGFYNVDLDLAGVDSESELAWNVGAGYNFKWGERNLFAEIRYLSIQTEGDAITTLPVVIGFRF